jgi:hypothetical protein
LVKQRLDIAFEAHLRGGEGRKKNAKEQRRASQGGPARYSYKGELSTASKRRYFVRVQPHALP